MANNYYAVSYNAAARRDLEEAYLYFADKLLLPNTGKVVIEAIDAEINRYLSYMPHHPLVNNDDLAALGYRRLIVKRYGYLVFFRVDENTNTVTVSRILHGSRDWLNVLLKDEESAERWNM